MTGGDPGKKNLLQLARWPGLDASLEVIVLDGGLIWFDSSWSSIGSCCKSKHSWTLLLKSVTFKGSGLYQDAFVKVRAFCFQGHFFNSIKWLMGGKTPTESLCYCRKCLPKAKCNLKHLILFVSFLSDNLTVATSLELIMCYSRKIFFSSIAVLQKSLGVSTRHFISISSEVASVPCFNV